MATTIQECVDMVKQVEAVDEKRVFGVGHGAPRLPCLLCELS